MLQALINYVQDSNPNWTQTNVHVLQGIERQAYELWTHISSQCKFASMTEELALALGSFSFVWKYDCMDEADWDIKHFDISMTLLNSLYPECSKKLLVQAELLVFRCVFHATENNKKETIKGQ